MRAALLEQENLRLRFEVERLRTEIDRHRIVALNTKIVADAVNSGNSNNSNTTVVNVQLPFTTTPSTVISSHSSNP